MTEITDAELAAVMAAVQGISDAPPADLEIEVEAIDFSITPERLTTPGLSTPPKPKPQGATTKISLRVPTATLAAYKGRAAKLGTKYQSAIIADLRAAVTRSGTE